MTTDAAPERMRIRARTRPVRRAAEPLAVTLEEAAERLSVGVTKVRELVRAGRIPSFTLDCTNGCEGPCTHRKNRLIDVSDLQAYVERRKRAEGWA